MASNGTLKNLSKALGLAEGYIKGLAKGNKKGKDDFITMNTANACRAVAQFTGYRSEDAAKKAIAKNIHMLYQSPESLVKKLEKMITKVGKAKAKIIQEAITHAKSGNGSAYNKLFNKANGMEYLKRKFAKSVKKKLVDDFRSSEKTSWKTAKALLQREKSPDGNRIIAPSEKIEAAVKSRAKRFGAIGSLFWQAAKQLNPKIKAKNLHPAKRRKIKPSEGAKYTSKIDKTSVMAVVNHKAENINGKFLKKLTKRIKQQEEFWAKKAEKEMLAAKFLDKLLDV